MDKYDRAIAELRKMDIEDVICLWNNAIKPRDWYDDEDPSILFAKTARSGCGVSMRECGCLTQVRCGYMCGVKSLESEIRSDYRIPHEGSLIKFDDLPVFAEWQRRIDAELEKQDKETVNEAV